MRRCCAFSTIHLKLLSFADVEWEVVFLAPECQSMHLFSVGRLIIDMWTWRILLKPASHICTQAMLPALEAILGHRSAHSLVTGPVIAEPTKDNKNYLALHRSKTQNIPLKWQVSRTCSTTDWDLTAHGDCHLTQQQWDLLFLHWRLTQPQSRQSKCFKKDTTQDLTFITHLSFLLCYSLWPLHCLQSIETRHLFADTTSAVVSPPQDALD